MTDETKDDDAALFFDPEAALSADNYRHLQAASSPNAALPRSQATSPRTAFFQSDSRLRRPMPYESIDTEEGEEGDLKPLTSTRMRIRRKSKLMSDVCFPLKEDEVPLTSCNFNSPKTASV